MEILNFVATVIFVTASGALAPGPLFFASLSQGVKAGAIIGLVFSVAHMLVEFTLVMLLTFGLLNIASEPMAKLGIGIAGGVVLLVCGIVQIHSSISSKPERTAREQSGKVASRNLFLMGLAFTGLNPFFVVWWLTAGAQLIMISLEFASLLGVVFMYLCHVWMDYVWLIAITHFARIGMNVVGFKLYRFVMVVFGIVLIYFGFTFLVGSFTL